MCRIAVIGGSIAGLLTSYYLNRFCDVYIYEAADRVGLRGRRCTGLVSVETSSRMPNSRKFVENSYKKITIFLGDGLSVAIMSKRPFAVKLNRELYELELSSILESQDVRIRLSSRVTQVVPKPHLEVVVKTKSYSGEYNGAVLAEGYPPVVTESITPRISIRRVMVAVQRKFRVQGLKELDEIIVEMDGGAFSWFLPLNDSEALVGVASENLPKYREAVAIIDSRAAMFEKKLKVKLSPISKLTGGYIFRGYPNRVRLKSGIYVIGDAAAMSKSLSGGGLYAISISAQVISNALKREIEGEYPIEELKLISSLQEELRKQYLLAVQASRILKIMSVLRFSPRLRMIYEGVDFNYDDHVGLLLKLIKQVPSVRWVLYRQTF